jgi:hypothetical protein
MDAMRSSSCGRMMGGGSVSLKVVREKIPRRAEEVRRRRRASWMIPLQVPLHLHSRLELLSSIL